MVIRQALRDFKGEQLYKYYFVVFETKAPSALGTSRNYPNRKMHGTYLGKLGAGEAKPIYISPED